MEAVGVFGSDVRGHDFHEVVPLLPPPRELEMNTGGSYLLIDLPLFPLHSFLYFVKVIRNLHKVCSLKQFIQNFLLFSRVIFN